MRILVESDNSGVQWAVALLAKDEFFIQLSEQDCNRIINESIVFGAHLAEKIREKMGLPSGPESIRQKLMTLGCGVRVDDETGPPGPLSEYEEDLLAARFFTFRIRRRAEEAVEHGEWSSGWYDLYEQCLARELFHHVENTISGKASHHIRFKERLLGIVPVSRPVEASRQIAGAVFVRDYLGLSTIPLLTREA